LIYLGFSVKVFEHMAAEKTISKTNIKWSPVDMDARKKLDFRAGDTLRVWSKIKDEKGKFRTQAFEGMVLARKHGTEIGGTFTLRRVASGVGVERIFPLYSPMIDKIEIVKKAHARRSKLYYIRTKAVKDVRRKMRSVANDIGAEEEEAVPASE
jgi:large subunit ribosomal protein L19